MHSNQPLLSYWCGQMFTRSDSQWQMFLANSAIITITIITTIIIIPAFSCVFLWWNVFSQRPALRLRLAPLQVSLTRADHGKPIVCWPLLKQWRSFEQSRGLAHLSMYPDGDPFRPSSLSCSAARICGFCIICTVSWRAAGQREKKKKR